MNNTGLEPRVYLGKSCIILRGLSDQQTEKIKVAWGPFLLLDETDREDKTNLHSPHSVLLNDTLPNRAGSSYRAHAQESWVIRFKHEQAPTDITPDYHRSDDVFLCIQCPRKKIVLSWIDGSLGAIEASIQIVLQKALARRDGLLVHASAGIYKSQGILVPGPSGTGKSTIAREAGFDQVLSDEMVVVEKLASSDKEATFDYQLFSTPFWSEGRTLPLIMAHAPLSLICYPIQSNDSQFLDCTITEAVAHLLSAITLYELGSADSNEQQTKLFDIACHLCTNTLNQKLKFPKVGPWLHLLSWPEAFHRSP